VTHSDHFAALTPEERERAICSLLFWAANSPSDEELMAMPDDVRAAAIETAGVRARWTLTDLVDALAALPPEVRDAITALGERQDP
jgi:hypothetical protein